MIWLFLFFILIIICVTLGFYLCWRFTKKDLYDHFSDYVIENWKMYASLVAGFSLLTLLYVSPVLVKATKCSIQGHIMHTTTQYSWVMGECQAQNASGSFVDIRRVRGLPSDHDDQDDSH